MAGQLLAKHRLVTDNAYERLAASQQSEVAPTEIDTELESISETDGAVLPLRLEDMFVPIGDFASPGEKKKDSLLSEHFTITPKSQSITKTIFATEYDDSWQHHHRQHWQQWQFLIVGKGPDADEVQTWSSFFF